MKFIVSGCGMRKSSFFQQHNKLADSLKRAYARFLKIRGEPREIGLGFALGIFIGMTPFMGFHTASAVFLAALFKWNKIAAAAAVWISNPATAPLVYGSTYYVGAKATRVDKINGAPNFFSFDGLYNLFCNAPEILWVLTVGGILIGIPLSIASYYFVVGTVKKYRKDLREKIHHPIKTAKTVLEKRSHGQKPEDPPRENATEVSENSPS